MHTKAHSSVVGNYDNFVGAFFVLCFAVMCIFLFFFLCYVNLFPCTSKCKELGVCCQRTRDPFWLFGRKKASKKNSDVFCRVWKFIFPLLSTKYLYVFVLVYTCNCCHHFWMLPMQFKFLGISKTEKITNEIKRSMKKWKQRWQMDTSLWEVAMRVEWILERFSPCIEKMKRNR